MVAAGCECQDESCSRCALYRDTTWIGTECAEGECHAPIATERTMAAVAQSVVRWWKPTLRVDRSGTRARHGLRRQWSGWAGSRTGSAKAAALALAVVQGAAPRDRSPVFAIAAVGRVAKGEGDACAVVVRSTTCGSGWCC